MGAEVTTTTSWRLGNFLGQNLVLSDLVTGPTGNERTFKYNPGEVHDLAVYFDEKDLKRSKSLRDAMDAGWLKLVGENTASVSLVPNPLGNGPAPANEFDDRLVDLLDQEEAEEARLKESTADALANRARRVRNERAAQAAK